MEWVWVSKYGAQLEQGFKMTFSPDWKVHVKRMLSQKNVLTGPRTRVGARQFHENTLYMNISISPTPPPPPPKKKFAPILKDAILLMNVLPNMFVSHAGRRGSSSTEGIAKCTYLAT